LQGDVIALLDADGTKVVSYTYDAWGKLISKTGSLATSLGSLNPFRYRGYIYDEETALYYLANRFYSATLLRFLNSDSIVSSNLFVYCTNNPVTFIDYTGNEKTRPVPYGGYSNCYTYAFKIEYDPFTQLEFTEAKSPGDFYRERHPYSLYNLGLDYNHTIFESHAEGLIIADVRRDGEVLGFTIEKVPDGSGEVTDDSWIVALAFYWEASGEGALGSIPHALDYHWYRKDGEGKWSQQVRQHGEIQSTDSAGVPIVDPATCDRTRRNKTGSYNYFVGYYRVTRTR
jgi:RHS repeat-associated protein